MYTSLGLNEVNVALQWALPWQPISLSHPGLTHIHSSIAKWKKNFCQRMYIQFKSAHIGFRKKHTRTHTMHFPNTPDSPMKTLWNIQKASPWFIFYLSQLLFFLCMFVCMKQEEVLSVCMLASKHSFRCGYTVYKTAWWRRPPLWRWFVRLYLNFCCHACA